jgi:beta-exotoxin I transport system permease protein
MKRLSLVRKTMREVRGGTIGYSLTTFFMGLLVLWLYPTYKDAFKNAPESLRRLLGEEAPLGSFEQFVAQEFFFWIPILLIVFVVMGATSTLAGEEGAGTLDLLMAQPVKRSRVVLEKVGGLALAVTITVLASLPGFLLGAIATGLGSQMGRITIATLNMLPLIFLFLMISLWASATVQTRGAAIAIVAAVGIGTFCLNLVGSMVDGMTFLRYGSPFYWSDASHVLMQGFDWIRAGTLLLVAAAFLGLALWSFNRRDLGVGRQEFSLRSLLSLRLPGPRRPSHSS